MGDFDKEYLHDLRERYSEITKLDITQQAEQFKTRFVLSIGEDILAVDDRVLIFQKHLRNNSTSFEYNDPNLNKFLEECKVDFESFLVRNQKLNVFVGETLKNRMTFIQFLLYDYQKMILQDYFNRWGIDSSSSREALKQNDDYVTQAVLSEFLDQPPYGENPELDKLTREERETIVKYYKKKTELQRIVDASAGKPVLGVKAQRAKHDLALMESNNIDEQVNIIRSNINKMANALMRQQKQAISDIYSGTFTGGNAEEIADRHYVLPTPWTEHLHEETNTYYYFNPETNVTQWERP